MRPHSNFFPFRAIHFMFCLCFKIRVSPPMKGSVPFRCLVIGAHQGNTIVVEILVVFMIKQVIHVDLPCVTFYFLKFGIRP